MIKEGKCFSKVLRQILESGWKLKLSILWLCFCNHRIVWQRRTLEDIFLSFDGIKILFCRLSFGYDLLLCTFESQRLSLKQHYYYHSIKLVAYFYNKYIYLPAVNCCWVDVFVCVVISVGNNFDKLYFVIKLLTQNKFTSILFILHLNKNVYTTRYKVSWHRRFSFPI